MIRNFILKEYSDLFTELGTFKIEYDIKWIFNAIPEENIFSQQRKKIERNYYEFELIRKS